jgi:hypothetical protein
MVVNRDSTKKFTSCTPAVERFLAQRLIDEVRSLHARFDNEYTQGWLVDTEALL